MTRRELLQMLHRPKREVDESLATLESEEIKQIQNGRKKVIKLNAASDANTQSTALQEY